MVGHQVLGMATRFLHLNLKYRRHLQNGIRDESRFKNVDLDNVSESENSQFSKNLLLESINDPTFIIIVITCKISVRLFSNFVR
jgi:hypothetical protein